MKTIKKIYAYGSSFTQGGGFEWEGYNKINLNNFYSKFAPEEEQTQFNYSWPGQLKKLSGGVSVINQGKSGYGLERAIRLGMEDVMTERNMRKLDKTLFLFEFPSLGRKEYYFNPIDDYIISNYTWKIDNDKNQFHEDRDAMKYSLWSIFDPGHTEGFGCTTGVFYLFHSLVYYLEIFFPVWLPLAPQVQQNWFSF